MPQVLNIANAKKWITNEKGGNELIALLEAEGLAYRRDKASGAIVIQFAGTSVKVENKESKQAIAELLEKVIAILGPAAERTYPEANGMSFASLRSRLSAVVAEDSEISPARTVIGR